MLKRLVGWSLEHGTVVLALAGLLLGYGSFVAAHAKLDVFPEFAPPQVIIPTEAPGLAPEEVEALVTRPVESAVNGVGNLASIRSQSIQGLSVVTAVFREGTDILRARQLVSERLTEAAEQLPSGVGPPAMAPLTSSTSVMLSLGLTSTQRSPMELRTFADWTLRPRLLGVPGVAKIAVFGGERRQLQIQVKPERLQEYGLAVTDLLAVARKATGVRGAGFIETPNQRIVLKTEGQTLTPAELGAVVVAPHEGAAVHLSDLADIADAPEPKLGDAAIMGQPGVILQVSSQFGANTLDVTRAVEQTLQELRPTFEAAAITLHPALFRPANFITTAVHNVFVALLLGGILVAVVLFLFLLDLRSACISFIAIPLSLLAAIIALDRWGFSLNTLTLSGLVIAIGVVVDDAIIGVENVLRRLRENRALSQPRPLMAVVLEASLEVRSPVVYATFVVALVFVPVLLMSGIQGRLFAPLATAFILAILASLVVALTVTPALCWLFLRRTTRSEPRYVQWLKARHEHWLEHVVERPRLLGTLGCAVTLAALATVPWFGGEFLPEFREDHFIVHMSAVPGTSLEESLRLGHQVTAALRKQPQVHLVSQRVGRAEQADDTWGTHYSEFDVALRPLHGEEGERVQSELRAVLARFPGATFAVKPFLTERIEETISGATAQVAIKLYGDALDTLDQQAQAVAQMLGTIRGAADVQLESQPLTPQLVTHLQPARLAQYGFQPVEVLEAIQTAYQGTVVAQTYDGNRVFDVSVILHPAARQDPERIGGLLLRNTQGVEVPLRELADIRQTTGRSLIVHDGTQRRQAVTCNVRGRDLVSFVAEVKRRLATLTFPPGVYAVVTGASEAQAQAQRELLMHALIAGVAIMLLLTLVLRNGRNLGLVLANLPFALVGGILAVWLSGGQLSIGSLVGFVTLFGITTRNSLMLVSHYEHLVTVEGVTWGREAAIRGATERLVPILMTALVTALGLLPLALGSEQPGREIEGPMALVILGGLVTSTTLNLLVLPTFALRYGRFAPSESSRVPLPSQPTP